MKPKHLSGLVLAVDKFLSPLILFFSKFGITANHITLLQAPFVVIMFFALIKHNFILATALLGTTLILDVLDGSWARVTNTANALGHKYDKVLDLFGIYALLAGLFILANSLSLFARSWSRSA